MLFRGCAATFLRSVFIALQVDQRKGTQHGLLPLLLFEPLFTVLKLLLSLALRFLRSEPYGRQINPRKGPKHTAGSSRCEQGEQVQRAKHTGRCASRWPLASPPVRGDSIEPFDNVLSTPSSVMLPLAAFLSIPERLDDADDVVETVARSSPGRACLSRGVRPELRRRADGCLGVSAGTDAFPLGRMREPDVKIATGAQQMA